MKEASLGVCDFDGAVLGDKRREQRLLAMVAQATIGSMGTITGTFEDEAAREGAYRFLANEAVELEALRSAAALAGFARVRDLPFVFVPCDGSTVTLPSVHEDSEMGPVGNSWAKDLGVQVMSAIIVDPDGVTMGAAGQKFWTREPQKQASRTKDYAAGVKADHRLKKKEKRKLPIGEKETARWGEVMEQTIASSNEAGFAGKLWFQLDAGADFAHLLASATLLTSWVTVRTKNPRSLYEGLGLLRDEVLAAEPMGTMIVSVPGKPNRAPREATLQLTYVPVVLNLRLPGCAHVPAPLFAVQAREVSPVPKGSEPIHWLLLTNKPGSTLGDAKLVVRGYSTRWRIEEVHKTWKSVTKVEDSGLESLHGFSLWATILFSIAIRIERLKYLSRAQPDAPATVELEQYEVDALLAKRRSKSKRAPAGTLTLVTAVLWIADLGGYMNPRKGPPGSIVIARGLNRLRDFAQGFLAGSKKK